MKINRLKIYSYLVKIISIVLVKPLSIFPLKKTLVFESYPDFADNSKALFEKMIDRKLNKKYKIYWLVEEINKFKKNDIENVKFVSMKRDTVIQKILTEIRNAWILSSCQYYFYSHRNSARRKPRDGQVYFHLTHGMSLKNLAGMYDSKKDSYILAPSDFLAELRAYEYNTTQKKVKVMGFPRNDYLFTNKEILSQLSINKDIYDKVIVWMPTFRRLKKSDRNDTGTKTGSDIPILESEEDFKKINECLEHYKILLIIKPHPAQNMKFFIEPENFNNIRMITNDMLAKKNIELYEVLGKSDALITDYSSVYVDYLILNKPIGFSIDDLAEYSEKRGFLVENPLDYMPGLKIKNISDMQNFIISLSGGIDEYGVHRTKIMEKFNTYQDNNSSNRIIEFLNIE